MGFGTELLGCVIAKILETLPLERGDLVGKEHSLFS